MKRDGKERRKDKREGREKVKVKRNRCVGKGREAIKY